jgi:ABC-type uncharacterized transport system YnjBCD ATPase subunit
MPNASRIDIVMMKIDIGNIVMTVMLNIEWVLMMLDQIVADLMKQMLKFSRMMVQFTDQLMSGLPVLMVSQFATDVPAFSKVILLMMNHN